MLSDPANDEEPPKHATPSAVSSDLHPKDKDAADDGGQAENIICRVIHDCKSSGTGTGDVQDSLREEKGRESLQVSPRSNCTNGAVPIAMVQLCKVVKLLSLVSLAALFTVIYSSYNEKNNQLIPATLDRLVAANELKDTRIVQLEEKLASANQQLDNDRKLEQCEQCRSSLQNSLEKILSNGATMTAMNDGLVAANKEKDTRITELEEKMSSAEQERDDAKADNKKCEKNQSSLQEELEKTRASSATMAAANDILVTANKQKDTQIAELNEKLSSTERELEEEKAKLRFKAFETTDELLRAVDAYIGSDASAKAAVHEKYGPVIGSWNVSRLTNFDHVFDGCHVNRNSDNLKAFNEDLSGWDVSRAMSMVEMFECAYAFNQPLSSWDVSRVGDMRWMFNRASNFNQPLSSWDVSTVSNMLGMFYHASKFNQPLSSWDVSRVSTMYAMFRNTASYNNDLSGWTIRNRADTRNMFDDAPLMDSSKKPRGVE